MKNLFTFFTAILISGILYAQSPQKMSYQAVVRDASNKLVVNHQVGMQISIVQSSEDGKVVYTEMQTPTTNANGLVSIKIGGGAGFTTIDWANGPYFIKTETDPAGGTSYTITGVSQLLSVPYALYAEKSGSPGPQGDKGDKGDKGDQGPRGIQGYDGANGLTTSVNGVTQINGAITLTKSNIGLGNVDNTSDANKPVSSDTQTALNLKVDKVTGKGLSSEDYSTAEKAKLAAISGDNTGDQDLSGYATTSTVTSGLATKVDKVTGKGLSSEDYTSPEKTKLAGIATGAEVNVQADWNQATATADDFIKNKPTLFTASDETDPVYSTDPAASITDAGSGEVITSSERTKLNGIEAQAEVNVQADWNQATTTADDFIKNKPTTITSAQATAITTNTSDITNLKSEQLTQNNAIALNTAKTGITSAQASAIVANTAKVGITPAQASAIVANTAKVGVTPGTAAGQMQYWNGSAWVIIAPGSNGAVLTLTGGVPKWKVELAAGEVENPTTGKIWMDRNLGASQVATSSTDVASYGDLYQWGRLTDGHEKRNSATTSTRSASDTPGHGNFITRSSSDWPFDWRNPQNNNLWQGVSGINNPCPSGYRVPTIAEWEAELSSWGSRNSAGAFASPLKLPLAGYRECTNSFINTSSFYWSSDLDGVFVFTLRFFDTNAFSSNCNRADGCSVRCIKD
ncbi:MAG: FISUMP domain-containing protein [Prolixibacteraceae bacterium]|nr:FISUMP domain-containing protein [Prolixibacteraceae bacterium]